MRRRVVMLAALAAVLAAREAAGDIYHVKSPSTLKTEKGSELKLPPGYFLDERTWQERDLEFKEAQEARTRLKAENVVLRKAATEYPWAATAVVGAFGLAAGIFIMAVR